MKILIVTGRTGGHFFPAKTFAQALKHEYPQAEVHYVLSQRTSGDLLEEESSNSKYFHYLPAFPWKGLFTPKVFQFAFSFVKAFFQSRKLLKMLRPKLVVGFGSYLSFPLIISARKWKIPTLIHEQNAEMGKANHMLAPYVSKIAVSFSDTRDERFPEKFVHTGNILRNDLFYAAQAKRENDNNHFHILVLGGSQGAHELNRLVTEGVALLSRELVKKIQIVHLTGAKDLESVREKYKNLGVEASVISFSNEMGKLYRQTDLLISRSGAGTLFESVLFQLPAILVPYPYAGSHQYQNAQALTQAGNSWILDQRTAAPQELADKLTSIMNHPEDLAHVRSRIRHILKVDDGQNLTRVAMSLINDKINFSANTEVRLETAN
ncbi:MAG: undecaprenyldiphospho-muramoylpentapeptide beta-N-acetylglucosaminyltransferase [Candidatus Omnitrophica bacterium]|nr:undecaprenyldiphospho-muramoylpentapeptide beta-N-acetylglucosaminyltransferase [Candidatus Omnitrophota bacterium]